VQAFRGQRALVGGGEGAGQHALVREPRHGPVLLVEGLVGVLEGALELIDGRGQAAAVDGERPVVEVSGEPGGGVLGGGATAAGVDRRQQALGLGNAADGVEVGAQRGAIVGDAGRRQRRLERGLRRLQAARPHRRLGLLNHRRRRLLGGERERAQRHPHRDQRHPSPSHHRELTSNHETEGNAAFCRSDGDHPAPKANALAPCRE
jgi:hypothetical protein